MFCEYALWSLASIHYRGHTECTQVRHRIIYTTSKWYCLTQGTGFSL